MDLGIVRRLTRLATDDGFFCVAALDHPENYLALLDPDITRVSYETAVESKLDLGAALARHASGLLLDPVYALGQAIATGALPGTPGSSPRSRCWRTGRTRRPAGTPPPGCVRSGPRRRWPSSASTGSS
ncbi:hypothetical protein [Phytohabitans rumicis]|uniref:Uncharacterized protein n=1 Tax=Phytohabitans rumicis TaxID=1076125 RepID=A0A6V8LBT5_9ACTN|nr:hypothetical protein [Phytohabitans rumicis]GFJ94662.1 hypothetical protein Prum_083040 [Phytohabitans rumicis]